MQYNTKQRASMDAFLESHAHGHFSMQDILEYARQNKIGTATVYRYLERLLKAGVLSKYVLTGSEGGTCFEYRGTACSLYHFVCNACGKCYHVDCPEIASVGSHINENHGFEVDMAETVFRGKCASCAGKELS